MATTPFWVKTHNTAYKVSSYVAKVAMVKSDPVERSTADLDNVIKCTSNSANFIGVANEAKDAGLMVWVNESDYFVGLVGTGGVLLDSFVKTDGAGGFMIAGSTDNAVAKALKAGAEGDYVEFAKLPIVQVIA